MELITFELQGKFAHFRKYFGNNTALSYALPPRTTLMGIFAAMLGRERDTYYREMASDRLRIGIGIVEPVKKSFHRLNNLMIKGGSDFRGRQGHVQTPFEVVTPFNLRTGLVKYRVFLSAFEDGNSLFQELGSKMEHSDLRYNVSLGPAFCHGQAVNFIRSSAGQWETHEGGGREVALHSAVPIEKIKAIVSGNEKFLLIEEEMLPGDFFEDGERTRELKSLHKVLFTTSGHPLRVKLEGSYHTCGMEHERINFTFLES